MDKRFNDVMTGAKVILLARVSWTYTVPLEVADSLASLLSNGTAPSL
jgi:hypothetical protein